MWYERELLHAVGNWWVQCTMDCRSCWIYSIIQSKGFIISLIRDYICCINDQQETNCLKDASPLWFDPMTLIGANQSSTRYKIWYNKDKSDWTLAETADQNRTSWAGVTPDVRWHGQRCWWLLALASALTGQTQHRTFCSFWHPLARNGQYIVSVPSPSQAGLLSEIAGWDPWMLFPATIVMVWLTTPEHNALARQDKHTLPGHVIVSKKSVVD